MARDVADLSDDPNEIEHLARRLDPAYNRFQVMSRLERLFRSGVVPDPPPDGFLPGRPVTTSTWAPVDGLVRRMARWYMPWQGKVFRREAATGVNLFVPSARFPIRVIWPGYAPEGVYHDRVEAFPFRGSVAPGEVDPDVEVLKIDYDFAPNPAFLIRRVLDELVQVAPGRYLGKVLLRARGRYRAMGYFSLRSP